MDRVGEGLVGEEDEREEDDKEAQRVEGESGRGAGQHPVIRWRRRTRDRKRPYRVGIWLPW